MAFMLQQSLSDDERDSMNEGRSSSLTLAQLERIYEQCLDKLEDRVVKQQLEGLQKTADKFQQSGKNHGAWVAETLASELKEAPQAKVWPPGDDEVWKVLNKMQLAGFAELLDEKAKDVGIKEIRSHADKGKLLNLFNFFRNHIRDMATERLRQVAKGRPFTQAERDGEAPQAVLLEQRLREEEVEQQRVHEEELRRIRMLREKDGQRKPFQEKLAQRQAALAAKQAELAERKNLREAENRLSKLSLNPIKVVKNSPNMRLSLGYLQARDMARRRSERLLQQGW